MTNRVLVVDDDDGVRSFMVDALRSADFAVDEANCVAAARKLTEKNAYDVVLTDLRMPGDNGMVLVSELSTHPSAPVVVVLTAHGTIDVAVEAMKLGAFEFLEKPIASPKALRDLVRSAMEKKGLDASEVEGIPSLSYGDPKMTLIESQLRKVAVTDATVLLTGESGTGKEVAAQTIHAWSKRSSHPFVAVNCASLSETLLESELFGHEKGAFTGATSRQTGKIEMAAGGTFFLDEVGELKPALQARLLRLLQESSFERVGSSQSTAADVRWIAASNRDLEAMVAEGGFREDLFHRLAVFPVHLPALNERSDDIPHLAGALLKRIAAGLGRPDLTLTEDALAVLSSSHFSGNIRELSNVLQRSAILSTSDQVSSSDLILLSDARGDAGGATMQQVEREAIRRALKHVGGNRREAAARLGIGLRTLYEKLKIYDLK